MDIEVYLEDVRDFNNEKNYKLDSSKSSVNEQKAQKVREEENYVVIGDIWSDGSW